MKIIYIGTTEFGIPTLDAIKKKYDIVLIITQPDRPAGRKRVTTPPPVKIWAEKNSILTLQPARIKDVKNKILEIKPDLILIAAYGQIIPQDILDIPKFKSINIHGSLLPKYRGASPIQTSLLNNDKRTGITLIEIDSELDHGPIIATEPVEISDHDNYASLHDKLSHASAKLVVHILPRWFSGSIKTTDQDHNNASFTSLIESNDARINWSENVITILSKIRALNPNPGTWTTLDGINVKILSGRILRETKVDLPGKLFKYSGELAIKCRDHSIILDQVLPSGKKIMSGKDYLNGIKNLENKIFI